MEIVKIAQLTGHQAAVYALAEGEAPQYIFSGAGEGWVVRWDLAQPDVGRLVAKVESNIFSLCYLKNLNKLVAGNMNGGVHFIDLNDAAQTKNVLHHQKGVFGILPLFGSVFTIGGDGILTRWTEAGNAVESLKMSSKSLRTLSYDATRNLLCVGSSDGNLYCINAQTLTVERTVKAHANSVFTAQFVPKTPYLLSGGRDAMLKLWAIDADTEGPIWAEPAHWYTINDVAFHPSDPTLFATASRDKTIKIWRLFPEEKPHVKLLKVINTIKHGCHVNSVNRLLWSSFHNYLISASDDRSLIVWKIG